MSYDTVSNFMELMIWQKGMELAKEVHKQVKKLPKEELYELSSQLRRASTSIPSNVSEGHSRISTKEYLNFLSIARGSCAEVQTQLLLCVDFEYLTDSDIERAMGLATEEHKMLTASINTMSARIEKGKK